MFYRSNCWELSSDDHLLKTRVRAHHKTNWRNWCHLFHRWCYVHL